VRWCRDGEFLAIFCVLNFQRAACSTLQDLHPKFALRPHRVWSTDVQSAAAEIRRGKRKKDDEEEERRNHRIKI